MIEVDRRVLAVVFAVQEGATTMPDIMRTVPGAKSTIYSWLCQARAMGLITWSPKTNGSIRPLVEVVQSERII